MSGLTTASPGAGGTRATRDASFSPDTAIATDDSGDTEVLVEASDDGSADAPPCPQDVPSTCPALVPAYTDVSPILLQYCAFCHQPGRYVPDITRYDTTYAARESIFTTLATCTMPTPWPTAVERQTLLAWLMCGAPN
jgi:hypothetical protein